MTDFQKFIKYAAIVLAVFLIFAIIGGIVKLIAGLSWLVGGKNSDLAGENKVYTLSQDIDRLYINIGAAELRIQIGNEYRLESNHKKLTVQDSDGKLRISEEKGRGGNYNGVKLTLTIPDAKPFKLADISTGAGTVYIEKLRADRLELKFGAGEVTVDRLHALEEANIQTGAGKVTVKDGEIRNLDLEMGVGELNMATALRGESDIDQGVGEINLTLKVYENADAYTFHVEKGIGEIRIDGKSVKNDSTYGNGSSIVNIEGGIGTINVSLKKSEL